MAEYVKTIPTVKERDNKDVVAPSKTTATSSSEMHHDHQPGATSKSPRAVSLPTAATSSSEMRHDHQPGASMSNDTAANDQVLTYLEECIAADTEEPELMREERKLIGSVVGQLNWAARQARFDSSYVASLVQQLAGQGKVSALKWLNLGIKRAQEEVILKVRNLHCALDEIMILSVSDAAYGAMPKGASQGGTMTLLASPRVMEGRAPVCVLEATSNKIHLVVRCSMSAEVSNLATAFEHGDYVRAVFAELVDPKFMTARWKIAVAQWKHVLITDAKTGYDVIQSEALPTDRKIAIDMGVLREAMLEHGSACMIRCIPGAICRVTALRSGTTTRP